MTITAPVRAVVPAAELAGLLGLKPPTPEQAQVIESPLTPSVVVAGAGSGKTETMAARVLWLVANQLVAPDAVLGLTFTRKAAAELSQRIRRRLTQWRYVLERERSSDPDRQAQLAQLLAGEPTVLTYSAFAGRLVAEHAMRVGAEPSARLLSQAVCWQLADSVVRRYQGDLPADIGALASVSQYVLALAAQLADHVITPDQVEQLGAELLERWEALPNSARGSAFPTGTREFVRSIEHRTELMTLVRDYAAAKKALPAVDFGDQMALAAQLADVPDVGLIERSRYGAVLLDEFQDTGHAQLRLLHGLFGGGHPVTAVGDPFQSIYGWRGASAGNIRRFATTFRTEVGAAARVFQLSTSWRNDRGVLIAANAVAEPLRADDPTAVLLHPRPDAPVGQVVSTMRETVEDEAGWLADRLAAEWAARPPGARTAAVLVRRRSQIAMIHEALLDRGLPVEVVGLGGLLTTPEVIDVVATLRVLADHKAASALARILTGARWRIGPRDLAALSARARQLVNDRRPDAEPAADEPAGPEVEREAASLVEALDDLGRPEAYTPDGYARLHALGDELRSLRRRLSAPLAEFVGEVERMVGIDVEVSAHPGRALTGRIHLDRFLDEAARFAAEADQATLTAFLAFLEAAEAEENGLEAGEAVVETERIQILTVHGAKGLEWDVVAVPGLLTGIFPAQASGQDWTRTRQALPFPLRGDRADLPALDMHTVSDRGELGHALATHGELVKARHLDEERRLAYVAFTRARSVLLASGYAWDSAKKAREPSTFLIELGAHAEVDGWFEPEPDADNPRLAQVRTASWPVDPLAGRRADVAAGAELVRAALVAGPPPAPRKALTTLPGLIDDPLDRASTWSRDVDLLLAERARRAASSSVAVPLPPTLSVSQLVVLREDPDELARRLRRPLPARPAPRARRGTAFHAWLETRWSAQTLLDVDDLPGAADESASDWLNTSDLEELQAAFEASIWAARTPIDVEVPFEMAVGPVVIRGRMDAVFAEPGPGPGPTEWTVVDWKTGRRPTGAAAQAAGVQLAAYRLAWARLNGLGDDELHRVGAAFHYVRDNLTVSPVDLLDADGLAALVATGADADD